MIRVSGSECRDVQGITLEAPARPTWVHVGMDESAAGDFVPAPRHRGASNAIGTEDVSLRPGETSDNLTGDMFTAQYAAQP
jgi:hypothetical protein